MGPGPRHFEIIKEHLGERRLVSDHCPLRGLACGAIRRQTLKNQFSERHCFPIDFFVFRPATSSYFYWFLCISIILFIFHCIVIDFFVCPPILLYFLWFLRILIDFFEFLRISIDFVVFPLISLHFIVFPRIYSYPPEICSHWLLNWGLLAPSTPELMYQRGGVTPVSHT